MKKKPSDILLDWYDRAGRKLPWRGPTGEPSPPYHVWISEIMLQQTTTVTVAPYYREFLARWPRIEDLAAAPLDDVLHAWAGLGYYARARNLHKCAQIICRDHGGVLPDTEADLRALPGIGPYTAAAISAIAFDRPATVVDGNVERVMARVHGVETPLPGAKAALWDLARALTPARRPGDYAQALMDLGATVCTPRNPSCGACPWGGACVARAQGIAAELPRRDPRAKRPTRRGAAFWTLRRDGCILLRRRPDEGLLGGMIELPSTPWRSRPWSPAAALVHAPATADWQAVPGTVRHVFTHFALEITLFAGHVETLEDGIWRRPDETGDLALASLTRKLIRHAQSHQA